MGRPYPRPATGVDGLTVPTRKLPTATLSVLVFEDYYPLNGEFDACGGYRRGWPQRARRLGLLLQVTIFYQARGHRGLEAPTYDMFTIRCPNILADDRPVTAWTPACLEPGDGERPASRRQRDLRQCAADRDCE